MDCFLGLKKKMITKSYSTTEKCVGEQSCHRRHEYGGDYVGDRPLRLLQGTHQAHANNNIVFTKKKTTVSQLSN